MASKPSPSADPVTRVLRPLGSLRTGSVGATGGPSLGAAHSAQRLGAGVAVGLASRLGDEDRAAPWGLWQGAGGEPATQQLPNLALVRYAESLRRRRTPGRAAPRRGLPLTVRRRGGTAAGPRTGPGGLAQALMPVDRPERPDITAILRDGRRPAASPAPLPRPRTERGRH